MTSMSGVKPVERSCSTWARISSTVATWGGTHTSHRSSQTGPPGTERAHVVSVIGAPFLTRLMARVGGSKGDLVAEGAALVGAVLVAVVAGLAGRRMSVMLFAMTTRVLTVGHSTRTLEELLALLAAHGVGALCDVRRFPASRRHPQFNRDALERALPAAGPASGIEYLWLEGLGGRRSRQKGSPHTAWQVPAFAGYADHMESAEFAAAAEALLREAAARTTCILCAEARPEQCHRRLISDWLTVRGALVEHIVDAARTVPHALPPFLRVEGGRLIYDGGQLSLK
jgi:hypothetical protein